MLGTYYLTPRIRNPTINPDDSIEIDVYITGFGNVPVDIKLNTSYPASILKVDKEGHVGYAQTCIIIGKDRDNNIVKIATGNNELKDSETGETMPAIQKFPQSPTGSTFTLNEGFFLSSQTVSQLQGRKSDVLDKRILGESSWDGHPPIYIKLNTSPDAPPGNHKIVLSLYYSDGATSNIDEKDVVVHVKNVIERYQKWLEYIAVGAVISGLIQTIFTVLQYFKPSS